LCLGQAAGKQICLPPGVTMVTDRATDCRDATDGVHSRAKCEECCVSVADRYVGPNDETPHWKAQRAAFLASCKEACDAVDCPNNQHYQQKGDECLPSCGQAGGNTCAATQDGCRHRDGRLASRFFSSYDCNYCCEM